MNTKIPNTTQKKDEDIIFEEITRSSKNIWGNESKETESSEVRYPSPINGKYESLYDEIIQKCDPSKYMDNYMHDLLDEVHEFYMQAHENKEDIAFLKQLRSKITLKFGVKFSTEEIYKDLVYCLVPTRFKGNSAKFKIANSLYHQVLMNADNIDMLEDIKDIAVKNGIFKSMPIEDTNTEIDKVAIVGSVIGIIIFIFSLLFNLLRLL